MNARIEKLNASDLQLKNAEEKELRNTKKEKYLEELALDVERRKHQLSSEQEILQADRAAVKIQEEKNRQTEKDLLSLIEETASELSANARDKAERVYISKYRSVKGFYIGVLLYGILFTVLEAITQNRLRTDFTAFFAAIWEYLSWVFSFAAQSASEAFDLAQGIDQPVVASILSVIFAAVVFLFITGLVYGSTGFFCTGSGPSTMNTSGIM